MLGHRTSIELPDPVKSQEVLQKLGLVAGQPGAFD